MTETTYMIELVGGEHDGKLIRWHERPPRYFDVPKPPDMRWMEEPDPAEALELRIVRYRHAGIRDNGIDWYLYDGDR